MYKLTSALIILTTCYSVDMYPAGITEAPHPDDDNTVWHDCPDTQTEPEQTERQPVYIEIAYDWFKGALFWLSR